MQTKGNRHNAQKKDRTSKLLLVIYVIFLLLSVRLIAQIIYVKFIWNPKPELVNVVRPKELGEKVTAIRGTIYDCNDKPLSISIPTYEIRMDCTVRKAEFKKDKKKGAAREKAWRAKAAMLTDSLAKVFGKDVAYLRNRSRILTGREKGWMNMLIAKEVDFTTLKRMKEWPLFNESSFKGGLIVNTNYENRQYPYGGLAMQTIGEPGNKKGIEHSFDAALRGKDGFVWKRVIDNRDKIVDNDSTIIPVQHGMDLKTTLDINIQDIADKALRKQIGPEESIAGGCLILMEVKTGAIKAMVNLNRDKDGRLKELYNYALRETGEPGSVIKTVALTALLDDGKAQLSSRIPTNGGVMQGIRFPKDEHIRDYERQTQTNSIDLLTGFKKSSNYVLGTFVKDGYADEPQAYIDHMRNYLHDGWEFELGGVLPTFPTLPGRLKGDQTVLASAAVGYSSMFTPLNLLVFYNAIANGGMLMRPYIVDSMQEGERVTEKFKPVKVHRICSRETADSVSLALQQVVTSGTGSTLKKASQTIAGKTGTAWIAFDKNDWMGPKSRYMNKDGKRKYRATFVGFFPTEAPRYSVICTIFSRPMRGPVYGGQLPAKAIDEVIRKLYTLDTSWGMDISETGTIPTWSSEILPEAGLDEGKAPDLSGLGLSDAVYIIENNGYKCRYSGLGLVMKQTPAPGQPMKKGQTIWIELK